MMYRSRKRDPNDPKLKWRGHKQSAMFRSSAKNTHTKRWPPLKLVIKQKHYRKHTDRKPRYPSLLLMLDDLRGLPSKLKEATS